MDSIRKWFYKPRRDDTSLLAQFFYADESLNLVAAELDSFDGCKDPERCTLLVNRLRQCQDKVLNICNRIMDELIPDERADRGFRVKFPDDVMQDHLAGQLWFGAECLAAGSSIMNREVESGLMRPLAKFLTKSLENVRNLLREASLRTHAPTELAHDRLIESLKVFDHLLADFELCYVSAMVPVKTVHEYQLQQDVVVLFSETLHRALRLELLDQEKVDQCDPALMFTIPRLAIVTGLLIYPEGPLCLDTNPANMSEMFRPFRTLLVKIRELLSTLSKEELFSLEKMLCSSEDPNFVIPQPSTNCEANEPDDIEEEASEEENSVWTGDASECETVLERAPSQPDFPTTPDDSEQVPELEEDSELPAAILNGQWTLPVIPCACSEDTTMTRQGLVNRSVLGGECDCESAPGPSDISASDSVNYKQNVGLGDARTKDDGWTMAPTAEDDLRVRYKENWEALCASAGPMPTEPDDDKRQVNEPAAETGSLSTSCSSCQSTFSATSDSCSMTSETSSFNSECQDEAEVALALQAVQLATRHDARAKFRSSADLLHRLFVCISGAADQLQTNFAGDLRHILKTVFSINSGDDGDDDDEAQREATDTPPDSCEDALVWGGGVGESEGEGVRVGEGVVERVASPLWLPDEAAPACMSCHVVFTVIRRRHHCRNCGKVFCARCSSNYVPLPRFGHVKPVRVCNFCFVYQVTPFSVVESIPTD